MNNTYILEIGLEEMPADMILIAVQQLAEKIRTTCQQNNLAIENLETYSTPRRLAVLAAGLPDKQQDQVVEIKGPPAQIAKDENGQWSKAARGFATKNKVDLAELTIKDFKGKDFVFAQKEIKGQLTRQLLEEHVSAWITELTFPRNMRWGKYTMKYIRPIRWLVSLWNDQLLPVSLEMIQAKNLLYGHRFLHPDPIVLPHADQYSILMESLHVIVDYERRRSMIIEQVQELEKEHKFKVILEDELLEEVTNLVEWPTVLLGRFEEDFLELPAEVLVTAMAKHQRYFPVYNQNQALLPYFVTVRNGDAHGSDVVIHGNEKVIRARLKDARFFFQEDQRHDLTFFVEKAQQVVFFQKRGSLAQRTNRIQALSGYLATQLQLNEKQKTTIERIAELCKFDLQTQMVYEFPSLQGIMGEYYAGLKGENALISRGIREHYHPRFAQDSLPQEIEVIVVALADKLDMLATAFSLGITPKGSGDPYALRRMAQGVVQIVLESKLMVSIHDLYSKALEILDNQQSLNLDIPNIAQALSQFFELRQRYFLQEAGVRYDVIDALLKGKALLSLQQLLLADSLKENLDSPDFKRAVEAIVRAANISKTQNEIESIDETTLSESVEKELWEKVKLLREDKLDLNHYLPTLLTLEPAITAFFDKVMVMDEDPVNRQNRLFLCQSVANWSLRYMDLSCIVFSGES